jgi:hypothetical protein
LLDKDIASHYRGQDPEIEEHTAYLIPGDAVVIACIGTSSWTLTIMSKALAASSVVVCGLKCGPRPVLLLAV